MTFGGGIIGVVTGSIIAILIDGTTISGEIVNTILEPFTGLLALGVSVLIGMFFGIYPAFIAAKLNPIEALRYE